jgi:short-subunit dehydrogenase
MNNTKKQKVFLTGGTAGIGRATALLLVENGYDVFLIGRQESKLQDLMDDYQKRACEGHLEGKLIDVTDHKALDQVWNNYISKYGCPDVLINNVGIPYQSVMEQKDLSLDYLVNTNLWSYMWLSGTISNAMIQHQVEGDIIHMGSMSASVREEGSSAYVATKYPCNFN